MTLGELAPAEFVATAPTVQLEAAQRVLDYLVFHRGLLDDGPKAEGREALLERYLTLVRNVKEGVHVVITDPFQKATALLFELVMEDEFDPWEIDLARFTEQYLDRIRKEGTVDFAVLGRLLYMAWSILCLQSEALLHERERLLPLVVEVDASATPLEDGYLSDLTSPESLDVTTAILGTPDAPPLSQMVRHTETRPVTLWELVRAFGEAEEQARDALRIEERRERLREEQRAPPQVLVHGEIPQEDLDDLWTQCLRSPVGSEFSFHTLWRPTQGRDRLVAIFLACLFLARENVIELRQETLGEGDLRIVRTADIRAPPQVAEEA